MKSSRSFLTLLTAVALGLILVCPLHAQRQPQKPTPPPKKPTPPAQPSKQNSAVALATTFQVDGDRLTSQISDGTKDKIRISLSEAGADWWRAIAVIDKNGKKMFVERQEGVASTTTVLQLDRSRFGSNVKIEFWKAKLLGVHTYITSETYKLEDLLGKTVTFTWFEGIPSGDGGKPAAVTDPINDTVKIDGNKEVTVKTTDNLKSGQLDRGMVKFRMETAKGVTWWKAIKVFDNRNNALLIEKEGGTYSTSDLIEIDRGRLPKTVKIELWMAKFLGAHTHMKTLTYDAERLNGRTLTITFKAD